MSILISVYTIFAIISTTISYVALVKENKGYGLYLNEWFWCFFVGALWPFFALLFIYQTIKEKNRKKLEKLMSDKCGCGCGKEAKE